MLRLMSCLIFIILASNLFANSTKQNDKVLFEKIFTNWTDAFNRKELTASCDLFAKSIKADYQGIPQKNYSSICNGFRKIFQDKKCSYHYSFVLHQVYRSESLAAARITWYLLKSEGSKEISVTQDEGMDLLQKDSQGKWKIINYIAYPISS